MATRNAYKLFKRVIALSKSKEWEEAKKEWEEIKITEVDKEEDYGECLCGHTPIKEMIQLFNPITHNDIIVGNCCINKFFEIKDYNKIFDAIKKDKVNKAMIEDSFKKKAINEKEKDFMLNVWRKKHLSTKQAKWFDSIKPKIMKVYKK